MLAEFRSFLKTANVLPLAVGVIIGAAVGKVVSALADSIVMPFVGLLLPSGNWREAKVVLHLPSGSETSLLYGQLLGATIDFVIIAFVVFLCVRFNVRAASLYRDRAQDRLLNRCRALRLE